MSHEIILTQVIQCTPKIVSKQIHEYLKGYIIIQQTDNFSVFVKLQLKINNKKLDGRFYIIIHREKFYHDFDSYGSEPTIDVYQCKVGIS